MANDIDFIINSYNQTGAPLERYTFDVLTKQSNFKAQKQVPFLSSAIDMVAAIKLEDGILLILFVECKRPNQEKKPWVFETENAGKGAYCPFGWWDKEKGHLSEVPNPQFPDLGYGNQLEFDSATEVWEFDTSKPTHNPKTSERAYGGLRQVNAAYSKLCMDFRLFENLLRPGNYRHIFYVPLVVTTANLFLIGDYPAEKISATTGKVKTDSVKPTRKPWIHFKYALDQESSFVIHNKEDESVNQMYRPTFIVTASELREFVTSLYSDCSRYLLF